MTKLKYTAKFEEINIKNYKIETFEHEIINHKQYNDEQ